MKVSTLTLSLAFLLLMSYACQAPTQPGDDDTDTTATVTDGHNSQIALDWQGTYTGTVPCADCEGIETKLSLHEDQTYLMQTTYLGKDEQIFEQEGTFTWNAEGSTIILNGMEDGPAQYFVGENTLTQLDRSGQRISGELAQNYVLMKSNTNSGESSSDLYITDTRWKLVELMGKPVDSLVNGKAPFILFSSAEQRIQANGGCNNISGSYELKEGNRIAFSKMISTKMACQDMEVEDRLIKVLETADNYSLKGNQMTLNRARMAPLARFEVAPEHE